MWKSSKIIVNSIINISEELELETGEVSYKGVNAIRGFEED